MKISGSWSMGSLFLMMLVLAGCAAPVKKQAQADFLSDYSGLQPDGDTRLRYTSPDLGNYSSFMIDPVVMLFEQDAEDPTFSEEELRDLTGHINNRLTVALTENDGYKVVTSAAPGVARFRIGITNIDPSTGAANIIIYTKITGAGLGGVAVEAELVDAMTGKQLTAAIRWGNGSRILRAGFTRTGDAKILFNRWSNDARKTIDEAHGVSK